MADGTDHQRLQHAHGSEWARYCPRCAHGLEDRRVDVEQRMRKVCPACGFVFYLNPKVVAAAVPRQGPDIWLLRRNIEPARGLWTFPGGYVDLGETVPAAAVREAREETRLDIRLDGLLDIYSYAEADVVMVVYRATVVGGEASPTPESLEVRRFAPGDIPWEGLAFPSTRDALEDYLGIEAPPRGARKIPVGKE